MIIRNGTDKKIERIKTKLGLSGDVYIVNDHFIESLESHKRLIPASVVQTIEAAEEERITYIEIERIAAQEASSNAENRIDEKGGEPN